MRTKYLFIYALLVMMLTAGIRRAEAMGKQPEESVRSSVHENIEMPKAEFPQNNQTERHADPDVRAMQIEKGLIDPNKN